jgi:hypothetical protein
MLEYALGNDVAVCLVARKQRLVDFTRAKGFHIRTSFTGRGGLLDLPATPRTTYPDFNYVQYYGGGGRLEADTLLDWGREKERK